MIVAKGKDYKIRINKRCVIYINHKKEKKFVSIYHTGRRNGNTYISKEKSIIMKTFFLGV